MTAQAISPPTIPLQASVKSAQGATMTMRKLTALDNERSAREELRAVAREQAAWRPPAGH